MSNFKSNALTAVLYTAAAIQVLAVRGAKYYAGNEEEILAKLSEVTLCFITGVSVAYAKTREAAVATYELGVAARKAYEALLPEIKERVLELRPAN